MRAEERYMHYLSRTVTFDPIGGASYYSLRLPYTINGEPFDISGRQAKFVGSLMPPFTPKAAAETRKAEKQYTAMRLTNSGGLTLIGIGGLLALGGLMSDLAGDGVDNSYYVITGIVLPATGLTSALISIPLGFGAQKKFQRSLKTYDRELRSHYRISGL